MTLSSCLVLLAAASAVALRCHPRMSIDRGVVVPTTPTTPATPTPEPELAWDNIAVRKLLLDPEAGGPPRAISGAHLARVLPEPVVNPRLVVASLDALALLGVEPEGTAAAAAAPPAAAAGGAAAEEAAPELSPEQVAWLTRCLSGNELPAGAEPTAQCYCGYQFGIFAGQLGDGAVMSLGQVADGDGGRWEVQLKGAGLTPFSRNADGRKVLRSSIREYLASEAMHHLGGPRNSGAILAQFCAIVLTRLLLATGVPTTRAAALVTSDSTVQRDALYSGVAAAEPCAVLTRISRSFLRFGSFELCKAGDDNSVGGPSAGLDEEVPLPPCHAAPARRARLPSPIRSPAGSPAHPVTRPGRVGAPPSP